ncbi:MAG: META domain-containing protein [Dermatophilaceae bacterium]
MESIAGVPTVDPKPEVSFGEDGRVSGSTKINRVIGSYEDHGESLTILGGGTSWMVGPPEAMEQESRFLAAFTGAPGVEVAPGRFELGDSATGLVLVEAPSDPAVVAPSDPAAALSDRAAAAPSDPAAAETADGPDPSR